MRSCVSPKLHAVALLSTAGSIALTMQAYAQQPVTIELPGVEVISQKGQKATVPRAPSEEYVVSPTAIATPKDEIASSVTVITAQDIERQQIRTVPNALRTVPGISVVQTGGMGGLTSVFMRGTNSNHVKVLIDGIDVSDPSNPARAFDFGQLATADIERIEVLRGPQSGLYGADALGGVISIITKKGEGPARVTGFVEGGSFGTFNQAVGARGSKDRFDYAFNVTHLRSTDTPVTPLDLLPPGQRRNNDIYDNWTYSTRLGYALSDTFAVNFVARYTEAELGFTGDTCLNVFPFTCSPDAKRSLQLTDQFFTRGEVVWSPFGEVFKNYFSVAYTDHANINISPSQGRSFNDGDRVKTDWRGVWKVMPGQTVMMGLEHQNETLKTDSTSAEEYNQAGYIELQSELARRLFLAANVRYDNNENFGGHTTWRVAPAYIVPGTETKLRASVGTGFRAPTLNQRFVDFPAFGFFGNPNLRPEESLGWDAGFEQPLLNDRVRFGTTYFHNDITDLIQTNAAFTTVENIGKATTSGVEVFARWAITERFGVRADYTYTEATNDLTGDDLARRPRHKGSVTATWSPTDLLSLSAAVVETGSFLDVGRFGGPTFMASGYTVVNLAAEYKLNENLTLFGRADNLFDVDYQDPTGFLRPGLGLFVGLRVTNR